MNRGFGRLIAKMILSVCVLGFACSCATQVKPSLYFSLEDKFESGYRPGENLDGKPNKIHSDVKSNPNSSTVFGVGVLSRNLHWSNMKAIAEINLNKMYEKKKLKKATLNILLAPNNELDPAYREFDIYLFEGNGLIDYEDFSRAGVNIGRYNFTVPEYKTLKIEILDYVRQLLSKQKTYLGVRIEPIGNNPPSMTLVEFVQIK